MEQTPIQHVGKVISVIGPVVDIEFEGGQLPAIYNAVRVASEAGEGSTPIDVILEVEQHLGENRVRTVAMEPTDGMQRGMKAIDLGEGISVPVGPETLGRVLNVLGRPVDFPDKPVNAKERWPIHRPAPTLEPQRRHHPLAAYPNVRVVINDVDTHGNAFVADADIWPGDQLPHGMVRLVAARTTKRGAAHRALMVAYATVAEP